jgi:hypothetical protein
MVEHSATDGRAFRFAEGSWVRAPARSQTEEELFLIPLFLSHPAVMYSVYILYSKSFDRYYVGYTNNLERRISEHNRKKGKFTDAGIPWVLAHSEV